MIVMVKSILLCLTIWKFSYTLVCNRNGISSYNSKVLSLGILGEIIITVCNHQPQLLNTTYVLYPEC